MNPYTPEQYDNMATNVRDCAWPADVKEYMVLIEPMLREAGATLRQQAERGDVAVSDEVVERARIAYHNAPHSALRTAIEAVAPLLRTAPAEQGGRVDDRAALLYLMQQFDSETWQCPRCGHAEDTATMDSADYLRQYLKEHPQAALAQNTQAAPICNCGADYASPIVIHKKSCALFAQNTQGPRYSWSEDGKHVVADMTGDPGYWVAQNPQGETFPLAVGMSDGTVKHPTGDQLAGALHTERVENTQGEDWRIGMFNRWRERAQELGFAGIAEAVEAHAECARVAEQPLPMDTAPRDGTMLRLLVRFTEHATDDAEEAWTIGSNSFDANGEDEWQFAGWCWEHDHFTEGKGTPIRWLPMLAERARVPDGWRETLLAVLGELDKATGDSDPNVDPDMTDDEVRDEYPEVWVMQKLTGLLAAAPPHPEDAGEVGRG